MSATVTYTCDRCEAQAEPMTVIEGQPVALPFEWIRVGLEARPILHLCGLGCAPMFDRFLDGIVLVDE